MAEDYYKILGVSKSSTAEEIQKAYRKLARKYHPDLHTEKDEKEKNKAKQQFQKVQQAYDVLSDENKRRMYDQFGAGYEQMGGGGGNPYGGGGGRGGSPFGDIDLSQLFGGGGPGGAPQSGGGRGGGFEDILRQMGMGGRGSTQTQSRPSKAQDMELEITIPFAVAVLGGNHQVRVTRGNGKVDSINVKIPAGIESGKKIRLKGQGQQGSNGQASGDLLIKVKVAPHPNYTRNGLNLSVNVPITLLEASQGAKIDLPTPHGTVSVSVPPGSSGGKSLRLKGMGIRAKERSGDLIVVLQLQLPEKVSDADIEKIKQLEDEWQNAYRDEINW